MALLGSEFKKDLLQQQLDTCTWYFVQKMGYLSCKYSTV